MVFGRKYLKILNCFCVMLFRGMLEDDFNRKKAAIRQAVKEEN